MINTGSFATDLIFENAGIAAYVLIITFVLGTVFGSFINCLAWRVIHHESIVSGRSHCATCDHPLSALDLVPVFSYIILKGRCRYCHENISPRYMITELIMGSTFLVIMLRYGICFDMARYLALACVLLALSLVDLDTYEIPNGSIAAAVIIWAVTVPLVHDTWQNQLIQGAIGAFAIAGGMLLISLIFDKVSGKESLGGGDIKLFFVAGLYLGGLCGFLSVIVSCVIGLLFVVLLKKQKIPFGPSISIGLLLCAMWGDKAVNWYMNLLL